LYRAIIARPTLGLQVLALMSVTGAVAYRGKGNVYLNITNRCSCSCTFCLREFTDQVYGVPLALAYEPARDDILRELELELAQGPADEVVFCGLGEPTLRLPEVLAVSEWLALRRIPSRLNTNGLAQLANPDARVVPRLVAARLGAVSISLNAADPETYDLLCRPIFSKAFRAVLGFGRDCVEAELPTTLTVLAHPAVDIDACRALAKRMGAHFRVRGRALRGPASGAEASAAAPSAAAARSESGAPIEDS
jgi:GTP 3',8-cyclase